MHSFVVVGRQYATKCISEKMIQMSEIWVILLDSDEQKVDVGSPNVPWNNMHKLQ